MSYKGLIPPVDPKTKDRTVTVKVTEDEWESIKESRRNSCAYDLVEHGEECPYDSTADMDTADYYPFDDDLSSPSSYHCKCPDSQHIWFCEKCTL